MRVNTLLKDVTRQFVAASSGEEPASPAPESDVPGQYDLSSRLEPVHTGNKLLLMATNRPILVAKSGSGDKLPEAEHVQHLLPTSLHRHRKLEDL